MPVVPEKRNQKQPEVKPWSVAAELRLAASLNPVGSREGTVEVEAEKLIALAERLEGL